MPGGHPFFIYLFHSFYVLRKDKRDLIFKMSNSNYASGGQNASGHNASGHNASHNEASSNREKGSISSSKRFTSAIPGMSVSDMRRNLAEVRSLLQEQNKFRPFDMSEKIGNEGIKIWEFVHMVALGLHQKRSKSRKRNRVEGMDSDGESV